MSVVKCVNTIILFISFVFLSIAQVNTERKRLCLEESGISGNIGVTYSVTMGNSELIEFGLKPSLVWRGGKHQVFMLNDLSIVSSDDEDSISEGFSHLRYNYDITQRIIYELFLQAQYDKSQDLEERYLSGSGLRLIIFDKERSVIAGGLTGMYEYEELSSGKNTEIFRGSFYLSTRINIADKLKFANTVYLQPELGDLDDYRILNEGEFSVSISENMSFTSSVKYRYDSEPPPGIKNYDLELKNGLKFKF